MSFTVPPGPLAPLVHLDDFRSAVRPAPAVDADAVWGEVEAAARLFGTLRDAGLSVRFDAPDRPGPPRLVVTDLAGRALREVLPSVACDPVALEAELLGVGGDRS